MRKTQPLIGLGIAAVVLLGGSHYPASSSPFCAQSSEPVRYSRTVKGQTLTSTGMPAVQLKFEKGFRYAGSQDFILYSVARAEQHFFVDADKQGRIKRLYWIQFEGYLPDNKHTYRYTSTNTVRIGGLEFIADAYARNIKANPGRPDSDGNRAREFLASRGYKMAGDDVLSQRLVHLVDDAKRNELMIIYMEDLGGSGLVAADLAPDGKAAAQWDKIREALLDRALKGMTLSH
ncbi:MAG TPA: hypothetical protein VFV34_11380 [Blastocatellia bacterium]|nr:hypothetical protein [Blastocatellia bacterium]